jgi:hypothetical protein
MNKRGLILIFLFVIASVGAMAPAYAAEINTENQITFQTGAHNVTMGEVFVDVLLDVYIDEFTGETVYAFMFYYDVALTVWGAPLIYGYGDATYGSGQPQVDWYYTPVNTFPGLDYMYNESRFGGTWNVMLDDYSLGLSNFNPSGDFPDTIQDITLVLDSGWHTVTVIACELISDGNRTTMEYEYSADQVRFYVGYAGEEPNAAWDDAPYNNVTLESTAVLASELGQAFNYSDVGELRPVAEPIPELETQTFDLGTEDEPILAEVGFIYNATTGIPDFGDYGLGPYVNFTGHNDGPSDVIWCVNDILAVEADEYPLHTGVNYIYGVLSGFQADQWSWDYWPDGIGFGVPNVIMDVAIFTISVGMDEAGPTYGIFISVSIFGLVCALYLMRRRK